MRRSLGCAPLRRAQRQSIAALRNSEGLDSVSETPNFGQLAVPRPNDSATDETPLRIAVWGDFSGRSGREAPRSADALRSVRPRKAAFDDLDDLIGELSPKLKLTTSGGEELELEFGELDDFHPDPIYKNADVFNRLDDSRDDKVSSPAALQMRELLRHPAYQALESAWRGLAFLLRRVAKDRRVQVQLYDITADELRADLTSGDDLTQCATFDLLVNQSARSPDGIPWGMIVGLYAFELSGDDAAVLGRLAQVASHAGGPFLAAMNGSVAQRDSYELPDGLAAAWKSLRALPEASYVALTTPGFLLRPPFGDNFRPPDSIPFEEFDGRPEGYLWGNGAIASATLLAQNFMETGWGMNPASKRVLDNMPVHAYRDEHDEDVGVVTEVRFTSSVGTELAKLGLIPVLSFKGRDLVELAAIRSLSAAQPLLAGLWTGGGKITFAAPDEAASESVKLQGGPAPKSATVRSDDPEVDDDLASLLAGGSDDADADADSATDAAEDSRSDDDPSSDVETSSDDLDAMLAGLGNDETQGDDSSESDATDTADNATADDEIDLDALLAGLDNDDAGGDDSATAGDEAAPSNEEEEEIDLDALLAGLEDDDAPESDNADKTDSANAGDSNYDDLAALLAGGEDGGNSNDESDAKASTGSGDADLDALLAGGDGADSNAADAVENDEASSDAEPGQAESSEDAVPDDDVNLDDLLAGLEEEAITDAPPAESDDAEEDIDLDALLAGLDTGEEENAEESKMDTLLSDEETDAADTGVAEKNANMDTQDLAAAVSATQATTKYGASKVGSPAILDFLSLVQPISEDEPAGGSVPFDVRQKLDEMRREINPADFAEDDPLRPDEPVRADWPGVIRLCLKTLTETSKNLLIAARLTEALSRVHGYAGLRDGLHLFRQLVETCWDRLEPALDDDDDLEVRAAPFNWLDDADRGAVFPNTIRSLPIIVAGSERYGALHWQLAREGKEGLSTDVVERAVLSATPEQCRRVADDTAQALAELKQLVGELRLKMGGEAPGLSSVRSPIEEGATLAKQILARKGSDDAPEGVEETTTDGAGGQTVVVRQASRAVTRDDLYKQLNDAAAALQRMEPHSPVPYIIQRAVAFGTLPFPQLMQELIRDANVLTEMNRELGIKAPPSED